MIPFRSVNSRQDKNGPEIIMFRIDESESADAAFLEGAPHGAYVKNGTGDYTITLAKTSRRTPVVIGYAALTANLQASITVTTSTIQIVFTNNSGTATNTDFHLTVARFDSATVY